MKDRERYLERQRKYNRSEKGQARNERYEKTAKALRRKIEYDTARGRDPFIQRDELEEREAYEASGSSLSLIDWLNQERPLLRLRPLW